MGAVSGVEMDADEGASGKGNKDISKSKKDERLKRLLNRGAVWLLLRKRQGGAIISCVDSRASMDLVLWPLPR